MLEQEWYQYLRPRRVCLCLGLSKEDIEEAIKKYNIQNFQELQFYTKCSTNCKTCEPQVKEILIQYLTIQKKIIY